jgi:hypothetical protein
LTFNGLHSVISRKIVFFITTAVRTSNPTTFVISMKGKRVKLALFLIKHHALKTCGGVEMLPRHYLALGGGEWSASRLDRFTSEVRALGTHWIG